MRLVVGLGNPGKEHLKNRHNAGHLFVDYLEVKKDKKEVVTINAVKTTVFMNQSGDEVASLVKRRKIPLSHLVVAHDDIDLPLGEVKLQFGRGSAGHKGVESVIESLETKDFWRLRFGIEKPPKGVDGEQFVLSDFTEEETISLEEAFGKTLTLIKRCSNKEG